MTQLEKDPNSGKTRTPGSQGGTSDSRASARGVPVDSVTPRGFGAGASLKPGIRYTAGFIAGFLSVLIFSHGMIAVLYPAGIVSFEPWGMAPVPPFGVPQTLSAAFWGGLWGVVYALIEPRLTARLGWWLGGLVFGAALPMLVYWIVVMPLKGTPINMDWALSMAPLVSAALHTFFGLGVATFFRLGSRIAGPGASLARTGS
ncbi:MAG: hypothetical protein ACREB6_00790 [Rhodospirillales bacterium]